MIPGDLQLNLLQAFDALMRERHVTRAAERMNTSQSGMSHWLAKLRTIFGDELLVKTGTGWVPTERATRLWPHVQQAIEAIERMMQAEQTFDPAQAQHTFRLIAIDYIDIVLIPVVMQRLRQEAPHIRLEMLQPNPKHFADQLAQGQLDLVLTYMPQPPDFLQARRLFADRFVMLADRAHAALQADQASEMNAAMFSELAHITIEPDAAQIYNVQIDSSLAQLGFKRRVQMIKPSFLALPYVIAGTDLVACVPKRLAARMQHIAPITMHDLPLELPTFDVQMMWHPRTRGLPAHEWLRSVIAECARSL